MITTKHVPMYLVVLLFAVSVPVRSYAQADTDSVKHRNECRFAAQILSTGQPAVHAAWARSYISFCEPVEWAEAAATQIHRLRNSSDPQDLRLAWDQLGYIHDRRLYDAVSRVLVDPAASPKARVWAVVTLAKYVDPEGLYTINSVSDPAICMSRRALRGHASYRVGDPLPPDLKSKVKALAETLAASEGIPPQVRDSADCLRRAPHPRAIIDDAL